jgi:hypothetical protein
MHKSILDSFNNSPKDKGRNNGREKSSDLRLNVSGNLRDKLRGIIKGSGS